MTIRLITDGSNILDSEDALILIPTNTRGVMGRGLALEFARRYPEQEKYYKRFAPYTPGELYLSENDRLAGTYFGLAMTKDDWRKPSELRWISGIMHTLIEVSSSVGVNRVSVPALGAGLGGLDYPRVVLPEMVRILSGSERCLEMTFNLYYP